MQKWFHFVQICSQEAKTGLAAGLLHPDIDPAREREIR